MVAAVAEQWSPLVKNLNLANFTILLKLFSFLIICNKFFAPEMKTMTDLNGERWIFNFKKVVYTYAVYCTRRGGKGWLYIMV